jgi:flagellar hook-associated protein 2
MGNIAFGGLSSGLDTGSIIKQLLALESRPVNLLNTQRETLLSQQSAYKDLNTRISGLENAAFELTQVSSLLGRQANSSNKDTLLATASPNAVTGSYQIEVLQLATASRLSTGTGAGAGNTLGGVSDTTDFSGETLTQINTNNRLRNDLSTGTFFVNGQSVLVQDTDTLDDIFTKISTATGGAVTGDLVSDPLQGGNVLALSSGAPIVLSQGTSNFLNAFKLDTASYSGGVLQSSDAVNAVRTDVQLDGANGSANLAQSITSGVLTLNNKSIAYDTSTDTLDDILQRINAADAGVRATFSNAGGGRLNLVSSQSGPLSIQLSDTGTLASALGLNAVDSVQAGQSAKIKVDGGVAQSFNQNAGIQAAGAEGILLDLRSASVGNPVSVSVDVNIDSALEKIQGFVDQYNQLNDRISELTAFDPSTGKKGVLLSDFSVNNLRQRLNDMLFKRVNGLDGSSSQGSLAELGFNTGAIGSVPGTTSKLEFKASTFKAALEKDPNRVAQLLGAADTLSGSNVGVMSEVKSYLDRISNSTGIFSQRQKSAGVQIEGIGQRINDLNTRIDKKQVRLQAQFTLLERTLANLQSQQTSLSGLFNS